jgi:hypothetical protein
MINTNELIELEALVSHATLNTMSGKHKKVYKYCLCAILINIIVGRHNTKLQKQTIINTNNIKKCNRKSAIFNPLLKEYSKKVNDSLKELSFKEPYNDILLNNIVIFFRTRLKELREDEISLFQGREISSLIEINKFFGNPCIKEYHWIEFSLQKHMTVTFPEFIMFNDLKILWNYYLEIQNKINTKWVSIATEQDKFEYLKNQETRELLYTISAVHRNLITLCTGFVEAYLYNLFLSIKEENLSNKEAIESILNKKKIQDTEIIERVIFPLFPDINSDDSIEQLYRIHKDTINLRDRYTHASAFPDCSTKKSELMPLLKITPDVLVVSLQTSVDLVKRINELLPQNLKLLYWLDNEEYSESFNKNICFADYRKLEIVNQNSPMDKINYYDI